MDRGGVSRIDVLLRRFLEEQPTFAANPLGDWQELVGEQVARYSQPKSLKKKILVIVAHDAVWKHHLDMHREVLMDKINAKRLEPIVEKIVVRVGEVPEAPPVLNPNHRLLEKLGPKRQRSKKKNAPSRPLTPEEKHLLKNLPDPDLRAVGKRLLRRLPLEE